MNIYLLGYMGCGKSSTGKILAKKLNMTFVDLDQLIENSEQLKIESIFEKKGEGKFREMEHRYLKSISDHTNTVIALGGGTPCFNNNINIIKESGVSVYLKMSALALTNRLNNAKAERPILKNKTKEELSTFVEKSLAEREKFYVQANYTINAINLDIENLVTILKTK